MLLRFPLNAWSLHLVPLEVQDSPSLESRLNVQRSGNYEQGKLMEYDSETSLPCAKVLPTARDRHRLRGLQDMGCTRQLCLQQTEPPADSLPPSQLPRQHLSSGTNGGVGGCLLCCGRLRVFCWAELAYSAVQKGAGLSIWLVGVTNILDTLCGDCSQTSLVTDILGYTLSSCPCHP